MAKKIFVSGFSGIGKSYFTKTVSEKFNLSLIKEVIREEEVRCQATYLEKYIEIHTNKKLNNFICDRTVIDVLIWNRYDIKNINSDSMIKPDLVIIPPNPDMDYIMENIEYWLIDPVRLVSYNTKYNIELQNIPKNRICELLFADFVLEKNLLELYYQQFDWSYYSIRDFNPRNYLNWQVKAIDYLENFIKNI